MNTTLGIAFMGAANGMSEVDQKAEGLLVLTGLGGTAACAALAALGTPAWGFVPAGAFAGVTFPAFYVWTVDLLGADPRIGSAILTLCLTGATLGLIALRPLLAALGEGAVLGIMPALGAALAAALAVVLRLLQAGRGGWATIAPREAAPISDSNSPT